MNESKGADDISDIEDQEIGDIDIDVGDKVDDKILKDLDVDDKNKI